ncbi:hypothetical protein FQZ97_804450 [compost metagenome]
MLENSSWTLPVTVSVRALVCSSYGSAREGRVPVAWRGSCGSSGSGTWASACWSARSLSALAFVVRPASVGSVSLFGVAKLKALVRSPHTARRNGEMLGSFTPKRASMNRITEVWSKACEFTQPPRLQGEITYIGTRTPGP